jgi:hypothetical protein
MTRGASLSLLATLCLTATVAAQAPAAPPTGFRWQAAQTLTYRVEQTTTAVETLPKDKPDGSPSEETQRTDVVSRLAVVKSWKVLAVDAAGVATLQLTVDSLRLETVTPDGETTVFDSARPAGSNTPAQNENSQYVGKPITTIRVDAVGRVVEVKESKFGPASRFEAELPFRLALPEGGLTAAGQSWQRAFTLVLEPPQGEGQKFAAGQKYVCKGIAADGLATVSLSTTAEVGADTPADQQIPLWPMQPEGEVVFDTANGRLHSAKLRVLKELPNHRGPGTHYRFQTDYSETLVGVK